MSEEHKHWPFYFHSIKSRKKVVSRPEDQNGCNLFAIIAEPKQKAIGSVQHEWEPERNNGHASGLSRRRERECEKGWRRIELVGN